MTPLSTPTEAAGPVVGTAGRRDRPAETARAANIRDVARRAGVSHQTVSRVINGHPSLRPETRDRVLAAMDELSFRPNRAARALVTSRSTTIGVLVSKGFEYGPAASLQAIDSATREAGYAVDVAHQAVVSHPG